MVRLHQKIAWSREQRAESKPKRCIKISKNITPTLPSEGEGRVGGQKSPKVRSSCNLKKAFLPPELKGTKNILEKFFATIR
jgi:hypothetical protein